MFLQRRCRHLYPHPLWGPQYSWSPRRLASRSPAGLPLGCRPRTWDPRHRRSRCPGYLAAGSLVLSGMLHLPHKELGAVLDRSTVTHSTNHLNCVRCFEKEAWSCPGKGSPSSLVRKPDPFSSHSWQLGVSVSSFWMWLEKTRCRSKSSKAIFPPTGSFSLIASQRGKK